MRTKRQNIHNIKDIKASCPSSPVQSEPTIQSRTSALAVATLLMWASRAVLGDLNKSPPICPRVPQRRPLGWRLRKQAAIFLADMVQVLIEDNKESIFTSMFVACFILSLSGLLLVYNSTNKIDGRKLGWSDNVVHGDNNVTGENVIVRGNHNVTNITNNNIIEDSNRRGGLDLLKDDVNDIFKGFPHVREPFVISHQKPASYVAGIEERSLTF